MKENKKKKIYLYRHGETNLNVLGTIMGQNTSLDTCFTEKGYHQINSIVNEVLDKDIDVIYTSDLKRSLLTAEIINDKLCVPINSVIELRGLNMGTFQGLDMNKIAYSSISNACFNNHDIPFPNGESINQLNRRLIGFINKVCEKTDYSSILCITHSAAMSNLKAHLKSELYECVTSLELSWDNGIISVDSYSNVNADKKELIKKYVKE